MSHFSGKLPNIPVSIATKFRVYIGEIVAQNVPLTFQMDTFLNKMECFNEFLLTSAQKVGRRGF